MDTLLSLQALPPAAAPAVAIGGITLFFITQYAKDRKKSPNFPPPPGALSLSLSISYQLPKLAIYLYSIIQMKELSLVFMVLIKLISSRIV